MNSPPPTYIEEYSRLHTTISRQPRDYCSFASSSFSVLDTPLPFSTDTDDTSSIATNNLAATMTTTSKTNGTSYSQSENIHAFTLPPPPYPLQRLESYSRNDTSPSQISLSSSTIILPQEEMESSGGLSSLGATFYFNTIVTCSKMFLFAFHVVNIVITAINFNRCPYMVGNVSNLIPRLILSIHCFGVIYLAVKLWSAWLNLWKKKGEDTEFVAMREKCSLVSDKLHLFELLILLPLYTFFLLSVLPIFLYATPDFTCDLCQEFCDPLFFIFTSISTEIYAVLGVVIVTISYLLILLRFCSKALIQATKIFFLN